MRRNPEQPKIRIGCGSVAICDTVVLAWNHESDVCMMRAAQQKILLQPGRHIGAHLVNHLRKTDQDGKHNTAIVLNKIDTWVHELSQQVANRVEKEDTKHRDELIIF